MADDDLRKAVQALADHLQNTIKTAEFADVPGAIWDPFRRPSELFSTAVLRPLYSIFDKAKQNNALRLRPHTLSAIISITLHATPSFQQQRVLQKLTDAVRIYQDETTLLAALKNQRIEHVDKEKIGHHRRSLTSSLLRCTSKVIRSHNTTAEARWTATQLFSVAVKSNSDSRDLLYREHDCRYFGSVIQGSDDWILRYLVADIIRELLHHQMDPKLLWPSGTASEKMETFPFEEHCTSTWLSNIHNYFSEVDKSVAFAGGRSSCFWINEISRFHSSEPSRKHLDASNVIVAFSQQIRCLVSADALGLRLLEYPLLSSEIMATMPSMDDMVDSTLVDIQYDGDCGYVSSNGIKTSLTGIAIEFGAIDDVPAFLHEMYQARKDQVATDPIRDDGRQLSLIGRKLSYALLDIRDNEIDDDNFEGQDERVLRYPSSTTDMQLTQPPKDKLKSDFDDNNSLGQALVQLIESNIPDEDDPQRQPRARKDRVLSSEPNGTFNIARKSPRATKVHPAGTRENSRELSNAPVASLNGNKNRDQAGVSSAQTSPVQTRFSRHRSDRNSSANLTSESDNQQNPSKGLSRVEVEDSQSQSKATGSRRAKASQKQQAYITNDATVHSLSTSFPSEVSYIKKRPHHELKQLPKAVSVAPAKHPVEARSNDNTDWEQDLRSADMYDLSDEEPEDDRPSAKKKKGTAISSGARKAIQPTQSQRFKKPAVPAKTRAATRKQVVPPVRQTKRRTRAQAQRLHLEADGKENNNEFTSPADKEPSMHLAVFQNSSVKMPEPERHAQSNSGDGDDAVGNTTKLPGDSAAMPVEFSDDSVPDSPITRMGNKDMEGVGVDTENTDLYAGSDNGSLDEASPGEDVQDQLITNETATEGCTARPLSFGKSVNSLQKRSEDSNRQVKAFERPKRAQTGKHSVPSQSTAAFGNKTKFIHSVNGAGSASPTKVTSELLNPSGANTHSEVSKSKATQSESWNKELEESKSDGEPGGRQLHGSCGAILVLDPISADKITKRPKDPVNVKSVNGPDTFERAKEMNGVAPVTDATSTKQFRLVPGETKPVKNKAMGKPDLDASSNNGKSAVVDSSDRKPILQANKPHAHGSPSAEQDHKAGDKAASVVVLDDVFRDGLQTVVRLKSTPNKTRCGAELADPFTDDATQSGSKKRHSETRTPRRKSIPRPHLSFRHISESAAKKSPVVHFGRNGPENQGLATESPVPADSESRTAPAASARHGASKTSANRTSLPVDRTPSHRSTDRNLVHTSIMTVSAEKAQDLADADTIHHVENDAGIVFVAEESHAANFRLAPGLVNSPDVSVPNVQIESAMTESDVFTHNGMNISANAADEVSESGIVGHDISVRKPSDQDSDDPDEVDERSASRFRFRSHAEQASDCQQSKESALQFKSGVSELPDDDIDRTKEHVDLSAVHEGSKARQKPAIAIKQGDQSARRSIGLGQLVTSIHPAAAKSVTTKSFRFQKAALPSEKSKVLDGINPLCPTTTASPWTGDESNQSSCLPDVQSVSGEQVRKAEYMPPPPVTKFPAAATKSAETFETIKVSTETGITDLSTLPGARTAAQSQPRVKNPGPIRVNPYDMTESMIEELSSQPGGTPAPYHSRLETDIKYNQHDATYTTDDANDPTIVNLSRPTAGTLAQISLAQSELTRYATASSVDGSSALDDVEPPGGKTDRDSWSDRVRPAHRGLLKTVMQITTNVLFKLSVEEDAIQAKSSEYKHGGEIVVDELQDSWGTRMTHEKLVLKKNLDKAKMELQNARTECDKQLVIGGKPLVEMINLKGIHDGIKAKEKAATALLEPLVSPNAAGTGQMVGSKKENN